MRTTATEHPGPFSWQRRLSLDRWLGATIAYGIVAGLACFWRLGATGLVSMEGMVVDGARHMVASGDWLVPRVYGELYTYKPALAYWLGSIPLQIASQPPEWLIRLPFAASGFALGLAVLILVGRLVGPRIGLLSSVAVVTGPLFLQKARLAEFDIVLTAGVGVAVAAACYNLTAERARPGVWLLAYLALAAGFLAKGVPALMVFGPGLLAAGLLTGRSRRLLRSGHAAAVLAFVAISSGYLWLVWESAGPRAFEQPLLESKLRGLGWQWRQGGDVLSKMDGFRFAAGQGELAARPLGALATSLSKPALIWAAYLPWSLLLLLYNRSVGWRAANAAGRLGRAAAGFLTAGTLGFMAVPTHEMRYYLPLGVPLAILCGLVVGGRSGSSPGHDRALAGVCVGIAGAIATATIAAGLTVLSPPRVPEANRLALVAIGVAAAVSLFLVARRPRRDRVGLALVIASLCVIGAQRVGFEPHRASKRDLRPQALVLAGYLPADEPVWVLGPADLAGKHASLFFYLRRPIRSFVPGRGLPTRPSYCVLTSSAIDQLTGSSRLAFREIGRSDHAGYSYRVGTCSGLSAIAALAGG